MGTHDDDDDTKLRAIEERLHDLKERMRHVTSDEQALALESEIKTREQEKKDLLKRNSTVSPASSRQTSPAASDVEASRSQPRVTTGAASSNQPGMPVEGTPSRPAPTKAPSPARSRDATTATPSQSGTRSAGTPSRIDTRWRSGTITPNRVDPSIPSRRPGIAGSLLPPTRAAKRGAERETEQRRNDETHLAKHHTARLRKLCQEAIDLLAVLPQDITWTDNLISQARAEFAARAYGPFWDAVESAATNVGVINRRYRTLTESAADYYATLAGRTHTFGAFPVDFSTVPRVDPTVKRLTEVVRAGQTDFQFANIWEHRATRQVMIEGFRSLGSAVAGLAETVNTSIRGLEAALRSHSSSMVYELERTRDEHGRMLDNIQHHRQPR